MVKKSTRPHLSEYQTNWDKILKYIWHGPKPEIITTDYLTGHITPQLKKELTIKINSLLTNAKAIKIGKTGDAYIRADHKDYRGSYKSMHLIYRSTSPLHISELEAHYIKKYQKEHPKKTDNISPHSIGKDMVTYDGYYYLYVVTRH